MPRKCIVKTCKNTETMKRKGLIKGLLFHSFPTNEKRRNAWVLNLQILANQMGPIALDSRICCDHFDPRLYSVQPGGKKFCRIFPDKENEFSSKVEWLDDSERLSKSCKTQLPQGEYVANKRFKENDSVSNVETTVTTASTSLNSPPECCIKMEWLNDLDMLPDMFNEPLTKNAS